MSDSPGKSLYRALVVDTKEDSCVHLSQALQSTALFEEVQFILLPPNHGTFPDVSQCEVLLLGASIGKSVQDDLLAQAKTVERDSPLAVVVAVDNPEVEMLLSRVQSGAHGVLILPLETEPVGEVLLSALSIARDHKLNRSHFELVRSRLPKVLLEVADRLERLADELDRANAGTLAGVPVNSKILEEALLAAISASGSQEGSQISRFVSLIAGLVPKRGP